MKYILIIFLIFASKAYSDEKVNDCQLLVSKIKKNACIAKLEAKKKFSPIANIFKKTHEKLGGAVTKTEKGVGKAIKITDKTIKKIGVAAGEEGKKVGNAVKKTGKTIDKIIPDRK